MDGVVHNGNKPNGGLWTSTHTPDNRHPSDWIAGLRTARSPMAASMRQSGSGRRWLFALDVAPDANVLEIGSIADAIAFTDRYRIGSIPSMRELSPALTAEITDWAGIPFDAIHLRGDVIDQIVYNLKNGADINTAFHTWTTESTLWLKWRFTGIREIDGNLSR